MGMITMPFSASNSDDERKIWTCEVNFPPRKVVVTVSLVMLYLYGDGLGMAGISRVRIRQPDGSDKLLRWDSAFFDWKSRYHGDNVCSVTFAMAATEASVRALGVIHTF